MLLRLLLEFNQHVRSANIFSTLTVFFVKHVVYGDMLKPQLTHILVPASGLWRSLV